MTRTNQPLTIRKIFRSRQCARFRHRFRINNRKIPDSRPDLQFMARLRSTRLPKRIWTRQMTVSLSTFHQKRNFCHFHTLSSLPNISTCFKKFLFKFIYMSALANWLYCAIFTTVKHSWPVNHAVDSDPATIVKFDFSRQVWLVCSFYNTISSTIKAALNVVGWVKV